MRPGIRLVVGILVLEIAVEIHATQSIFVVEAISVVIDAFQVETVVA